jgi:hypothetical protein
MLIGCTVPELKAHEGSWIVTHIQTGEMREFFRSQRRHVEHFAANTNFKIEAIGTYLASLNA